MSEDGRPLQARRRRRPGGRSGLGATLVVMAADRFVYQPVAAALLHASGAIRRLQSGRLSGCLLYMLVVLLIILALIPTLD